MNPLRVCLRYMTLLQVTSQLRIMASVSSSAAKIHPWSATFSISRMQTNTFVCWVTKTSVSKKQTLLRGSLLFILLCLLLCFHLTRQSITCSNVALARHSKQAFSVLAFRNIVSISFARGLCWANRANWGNSVALFTTLSIYSWKLLFDNRKNTV